MGRRRRLFPARRFGPRHGDDLAQSTIAQKALGLAALIGYDVLTARPAFDANQIRHKDFRRAMSPGATPHCRIDDVIGRHFAESGKAAGLVLR